LFLEKGLGKQQEEGSPPDYPLGRPAKRTVYPVGDTTNQEVRTRGCPRAFRYSQAVTRKTPDFLLVGKQGGEKDSPLGKPE